MNNYCIKCGNKLKENENFCGKCGQNIKNKTNKKNMFSIIGLILTPITIITLIITLYKGILFPWILISIFLIIGITFSIIGLIKAKKEKNTYYKIISIISIIINCLITLTTSLIFLYTILFLILY